MKLKLLLWPLLACTCLAAACDDDDNALTADPSGTISLRMRNDKNNPTVLNGPCYYFACENKDGNLAPYYNETDDTEWLQITDENNFVGRNTACIGSVNGLADITTVPETGWYTKMAVEPGCGYVLSYERQSIYYSPDGETHYGAVDENGKWHEEAQTVTYYRLYVEEWLTDPEGGIIGALVKYQPLWQRRILPAQTL